MASLQLINSPLFENKLGETNEDSLPPLGLGYISSQCKANGIQCSLIDAVSDNIPLNDLIERINSANTEYVGLNAFSSNLGLVQRIVEAITPGKMILLGGPAARFLHDDFFLWNTQNQLVIVIGDAELIIPDILMGKTSIEPFERTGNRCVYAVEGTSYFPHNISQLSVDRSLFSNEPFTVKRWGVLEAHIVSSRGCAYSCAFCAASKKMNTEDTLRERSPESICAEIEDLQHRHEGITSIRVLDNLFIKNRDSTSKIEKIFSKRSLKWRAMGHLLSFIKHTNDDFQKLKETGCLELFIGFESGSPDVLKRIHKYSDIDKIKNIVEHIFEAGLSVKGYFIYGFPDETEKDMELTFALANHITTFAHKYNVKFKPSVFQFRPYHGTELYKQLVNRNTPIPPINPNNLLFGVTGKNQFQFSAGNFSACPEDLVHSYIERTSALQ